MLKVERFIQFKNIFFVVFIAICSLVLSSCISDDYDEGDTTRGNFDEQLMLTFVVPNMDVATRADEGYEDGSVYENLIDINNHDYSIYFFSYEGEEDETAGTLIAQFTPTRTVTSTSENVTHYTVSGKVPDELLEVNSFRVVVLANWGSYPTVTVGTTTIDDLTVGENTTFLASSKFQIDDSNLIPFYGVQEYTNLSLTEGETIELSPDIGLLRALAKIEVVVLEDSDAKIESIEIVYYNSEGYSAPFGVYTAKDYSNDYSIKYGEDGWEDVYVKELHLVGGENDHESKSQPFFLQENEELQTWRLYVPEYDNTDDDFSYISLKFEGDNTEYKIYFSQYVDGETDNNVIANRFNIKRNNFYSFKVEKNQNSISLSVYVNNWTLDGGETLDL